MINFDPNDIFSLFKCDLLVTRRAIISWSQVQIK